MANTLRSRFSPWTTAEACRPFQQFDEDERLDSRTIAASRMGLVALTAPQISGVQAGETAAVFGLGMVGNLAAQLYQLLGARVIALDPIPMRCEVAAKTGIKETVCVPPQDQARVLLEMTGGKGAQITVDAVGSSAVVSTCVACTAANGKIVLLGTPRAALDGNLTDILRPIHLKGLQLLGAFEWRLQPYAGVGITHSIQSNLKWLWNLIYEKKLKVDDLISHVVKPEGLQDAYFGLLNDKDHLPGCAGGLARVNARSAANLVSITIVYNTIAPKKVKKCQIVSTFVNFCQASVVVLQNMNTPPAPAPAGSFGDRGWGSQAMLKSRGYGFK